MYGEVLEKLGIKRNFEKNKIIKLLGITRNLPSMHAMRNPKHDRNETQKNTFFYENIVLSMLTTFQFPKIIPYSLVYSS